MKRLTSIWIIPIHLLYLTTPIPNPFPLKGKGVLGENFKNVGAFQAFYQIVHDNTSSRVIL
jgi:hypothetical protein